MADTAIPVYQTINEKGEATAEIEAVIKALGLSLTEKQISTAVNRISWFNETSGIEREGIVALGNEAADLHHLQAYALGNKSDAAALGMYVQNGESEIFAQLEGNAGNVSNKILDNLGRSRFLQVIGLADNWASNWGLAIVGPSSELRVSHGLGVEPSFIDVSPTANTNVSWCSETPNTTTFGIKNFHPSFGAAFFWFAIG